MRRRPILSSEGGMSVTCPDCGAVAGYGHEIPHRSSCPSLHRNPGGMRIRNTRGVVVQADQKMEEFYSDCLNSMAKIAREKYGDQPKVLHMIAALSRGVGMMLCACFPNERDQARDVSDANIDYALEKFAGGDPSPMTKQ
jgi:hypothetical protein